MSNPNSHEMPNDSTQELFKVNNSQNNVKKQQFNHSLSSENVSVNPHGIFLTHEQKIQATYNFQSLFRKKSHIYNLHKNKKKLLGKNTKNQSTKQDDTDKECKNVKKGHWTPEENKKYHLFLELHNKHFILKHLRRTDKIFKTMSSFIGSREAEQCRSHHQKMEKKYKNFYQIIIKLRLEYYGTCNTDAVRIDLQENGYMKDNGELLIEESQLKSMENNVEEGINSDDNDECKKICEEEQIQHFNEHESKSIEQDQQDKEKHGHCFFAENYEKELNYHKLY